VLSDVSWQPLCVGVEEGSEVMVEGEGEQGGGLEVGGVQRGRMVRRVVWLVCV